MTPERWREVKTWFHRAVEAAPGRRDAILDGADPEVRREVLALLASDGATVWDSLGSAVAEAAGATMAAAEPWTGRRLGPWRVTGVLGQGGMGTVLAAMRADGQYQRKVAIKLVKCEMDGEYARRRFLQERQILAALDHPSIARLLDGGNDDYGTPYLVMEHIDGRDILSYAAECDLSIEARLELFREVLRAVAFAHQKLIVHRDLKPANILVTPEGVPKLLDFGIARLIDPDIVGAAPLETATSMGLMTPDYASPEQVRGEPVAAASDIYSLGAVLYELLTGSRPHPLSTYSPAEIVAVVCHTVTRKPSEAAPPKLRRKLEGDLDVAVLTAMHKEAARRYPSAEAFARDITSYLEGRPLAARPDSLVYRCGKFVRRNKLGVAAVFLTVSALAGGLGTALVQARIARARFNDVRQLANRFLFDFDREIASVPGTVKARRLLVTTALQYLDSLSRSARGDAELTADLASAYQKVGDVQGMPGTASLGMPEEALRSYEKARVLWERIAPLAPRYARQLGLCFKGMASIRFYGGDPERAVRNADEAIATLEKLARAPDADAAMLHDLASAYATRCDALQRLRRDEEALASMLRALPYDTRWAASENTPAARYRLAINDLRVGGAYRNLGRFAEAEKILEEGRQRLDAVRASGPLNSGYERSAEIFEEFLASLDEPFFLGLTRGNAAQAALHYARAAEIGQRLAAADPSNRDAQMTLATDLLYEGGSLAVARPGRGVSEAERAMALFAELAKATGSFESTLQHSGAELIYAYALQAAGRPAEAIRAVETGLAELGRMRGGVGAEAIAGARRMAGDVHSLGGRIGAAEADYAAAARLAAEVAAQFGGSLKAMATVSRIYRSYGRLLLRQGRREEACRWFEKNEAIWKPWPAASEFAAKSRVDAAADREQCIAPNDSHRP